MDGSLLQSWSVTCLASLEFILTTPISSMLSADQLKVHILIPHKMVKVIPKIGR